MSVETRRWERISALFRQGIKLEDEARTRFLEEVRAGESEALFLELRDLLHHDARDEDSLEPPDTGALGEHLAAREIGHVLGPWRLEAVLGRGGMSTVYRARRFDEEFEQLAAVKLVRRGMDTEDILRRFRTERQVLADLDHPGIARLFDGGATEEGLPYLVMEYVQGLPVDRYCDEHSLDVEARLRLFLSIAGAVQHAHEHGVIHRDLKPSNILVTDEGRPKLLDFGIAKVLDTTASSGTVNVTATELRLMTPEYASPEQVRGHAIGPASDVYSLGVVLYELLSGHRPYQLSTRLRHELELAICELDPPRPSVAVGKGPESRRLRTRLAGDLDTIVLMALRKEPGRRYATVAELSEDLERWLDGRPVLARPDTWRYRTTKFVRRNRVVVGAALVVFLALVAGLVTSTSFWFESESARTQAEETLRRSRARGLAGASTEVLRTDTMLALLLAREAVGLHETPETLSRLHRAVSLVREQRVLRPGGGVSEVSFSLEGNALLVSGARAAILYDLDGGAVHRLDEGEHELYSARFSPSGEHVLTAKRDGKARLFDLEGEEPRCFDHGAGVLSAEFSPDGRFVLTSGVDGKTRIWNRDREGECTDELDGHEKYAMAIFSPDGTHILTTSTDSTGCLYRFSAESGTAEFVARLEGHEGAITCASFSPMGDRIVTVAGDGYWPFQVFGIPDRQARIWDLEGTPLTVLGDADDEVEFAIFSPSGEEILTGLYGRGGRLYDLEGHPLQDYPAPSSSAVMYRCAFSGDGKVVGFCSQNGGAWLFERSGALIGELYGHDEKVTVLRISPDGRSVATASLEGTLRIWSTREEVVPTLRGHPGTVNQAAFLPGGKKIATTAYDAARVWDVRGEELSILEGYEDLCLAVGTEGRRLVVGSRNSTARICDLEGGEPVVLPHDPEALAIKTVAISSDGKLVATGSTNGLAIWLWNADGTPRQRFPMAPEYASWTSHLEFGPDGERLLVAKSESPVLILSLEDGSVQPLDYAGYHASFTPAGQILIACQDRRVVLVTDRGEPVRKFPGHESAIYWAMMSPKQDRIVTASHDGTARIWRADGTLESILSGHEGYVCCARFSPEGDRVVTSSVDRTARVWIVEPAELRALADERSTRDFTEAEILRYEELLDVPALEASELVDRLIVELTEQERVMEHLRDGSDLDEELRELALRFAEARSDSP